MLKPADPPMQPEPGNERPIGELVHQLVEQGKAYAQAEIGVAKAVALGKVGALKVPAILLGAALLLVQAAVTVLAVAVLLALQPLIGPLLAGIVAFLIFAGIAGGLGWQAARMIGRDL
ncbi:MAG: phage holin family protein [Sphingomicrobium sp.]